MRQAVAPICNARQTFCISDTIPLMESEITVSLSPVVSQWVHTQAETRGFGTAGAFVTELVEREHQKAVDELIQRRLTKSMQSFVSQMTPGNWNDIRKAGRVRARRHD